MFPSLAVLSRTSSGIGRSPRSHMEIWLSWTSSAAASWLFSNQPRE